MTLKIGPQKCRALIWLANSYSSPGLFEYTPLIEILNFHKVCVDQVEIEGTDFWTGRIFDYRLVFVDWPVSDPSWWDALATWRGRLVILSDNASAFAGTDHYDWVNSKAGTTGLSVLGTDGFALEGTVETDSLTDGCTPPLLLAGGYSSISGGTTLSNTTDIFTEETVPWLAHNAPDAIDWVLSGDSGAFSGVFSDPGDAPNVKLVENLWFVPLP